jgi:hypothetical protein
VSATAPPRRDPDVRADSRCACGCGRPRPPAAVRYRDPFASSACCRRWWGLPHEPLGDDEAVLGLHAEGRRAGEIAAELGLSVQAVNAKLRAAGVERRRGRPGAAVLLQAERRGGAPEVERVREQAKERESAGKKDPSRSSGEGRKGRSDDEVALVGVSGDTVRRVEEAVATARSSAEASAA